MPHFTDGESEAKSLARSQTLSSLKGSERRVPAGSRFLQLVRRPHFAASAPFPHPTPARGARPAPGGACLGC